MRYTAPSNAADYLQQLSRLLQDPALRDRLRAAGLQRAREEFDWRVIVAAHEQVFARQLAAQNAA